MSASRTKEPQRIAKLLARAGVASRREIERMIAEGRIAIDGVTLDTPATLLASLRGVTVDGTPVQAAAPARLFIFHKPAGVLTTERDPAGRRTIYDVLPSDLPRLVPVGRLDLNTEGLLLMTTDGELKRELELPATGVERTYRARAYGDISQAQLEELIEGIEIEGIRYGSIDANLERRTGANVWIEMTLTEGKNREVRNVLEHLGLEVSRLIRTRYGPFNMADLPAGEIGEVRQHDLVAFRKTLALPAAKRNYEPVTARVAKPAAPEPVEAEAPARGRGGAGRPPLRKPSEVGIAQPARAARARKHREAGDDHAPSAAPVARPARGGKFRSAEERPERPAAGARPFRGRKPFDTAEERAPRDGAPGRRGPARPDRSVPAGERPVRTNPRRPRDEDAGTLTPRPRNPRAAREDQGKRVGREGPARPQRDAQARGPREDQGKRTGRDAQGRPPRDGQRAAPRDPQGRPPRDGQPRASRDGQDARPPRGGASDRPRRPGSGPSDRPRRDGGGPARPGARPKGPRK